MRPQSEYNLHCLFLVTVLHLPRSQNHTNFKSRADKPLTEPSTHSKSHYQTRKMQEHENVRWRPSDR